MGTLPAGGSFCSVKRNQNPLRAFPPKDRGWTCVKAMVGPGPGGVTWMAWQVYGKRPLLCEMVPLLPGPHPGEAAFPPPNAGPSIAGNSGPPGSGPGDRSTSFHRSRYILWNFHAIHVTPPVQGPKRGARRDSQYRGVDSTRRGKAPPLAILSPISHRGEIGPSGAQLL